MIFDACVWSVNPRMFCVSRLISTVKVFSFDLIHSNASTRCFKSAKMRRTKPVFSSVSVLATSKWSIISSACLWSSNPKTFWVSRLISTVHVFSLPLIHSSAAILCCSSAKKRRMRSASSSFSVLATSRSFMISNACSGSLKPRIFCVSLLISTVQQAGLSVPFDSPKLESSKSTALPAARTRTRCLRPALSLARKACTWCFVLMTRASLSTRPFLDSAFRFS